MKVSEKYSYCSWKIIEERKSENVPLFNEKDNIHSPVEIMGEFIIVEGLRFVKNNKIMALKQYNVI